MRRTGEKRIMKKIKENRGITLIALVVTIVVLLILSSVSISMLIGENGIISKAKEARDKYAQAIENDQVELGKLENCLKSELTNSEYNETDEDQLPFTDETRPYLPTGFSKLPGTNLSNGLVIQDPQGNQYVWVEVPRTATVYPTAGLNLNVNALTTMDYTKIENDLHTYTSAYRNGTSNTDTHYPDADNASDWFSETEYDTAKKNMLKSVYQNGGFYVGRYETGIAYDDQNGPRNFESSEYTALHPTTQIPVIKANAYPYNWVRRTQAKVLAENMYSGDKTSSLIFGVQWDLVLAFMHNKGEISDSTLTNDSNTMGNYADTKFSVTSEDAKHRICNQSSYTLENWNDVPANYEKPDSGTENYVLLTTGANEMRNSNMNICDIAGNVWEWTLEKTTDINNSCALRGGGFNDYCSDYPASHRGNFSTIYNYFNLGFRVSLY